MKAVKAYLLVLIVSFTGSLAFRLSIPVVAYHVREELEAPALVIGFITASYFVMRALSASISGEVSSRIRDYRLVPIVGFSASAIVVLAYAYTYTWVMVVLLRLVQGFLAGLMWIPLQYAVSVYSSESWRGKAYAVYFIVGASGAQLANIVYALMEPYGDLTILLLASILYIVSTLIVLFIPIPKPNTSNRRSSEKAVGDLRLSEIAPVLTAGFSVGFTLSIYYGDIPYVYVREALGLTRQDTALLLAVTGFLGLGLGLVASHIADRYPDKPILELTIVLLPLGLLLIGSGWLWLVIVGFSLLTVVSRVFTPLSRRIVTIKSGNPARAVGYLNALSNVGMAIGFIYVGYMYDLLGVSTRLMGLKLLVLPLTLLPISIMSLILTFYLARVLRR